QHSDVASLYRERAAALSTKTDIGAAARNAQHLVDPRMIVRIVEDPVAPAVAPAVALEQILEHRCGIELPRQTNGVTIDDEWPAWVIGNEPIVGKTKFVYLTLANQRQQPCRLRTGPAGHSLDNLSCAFHRGHGRVATSCPGRTTAARTPCSGSAN